MGKQLNWRVTAEVGIYQTRMEMHLSLYGNDRLRLDASVVTEILCAAYLVLASDCVEDSSSDMIAEAT